MIIRSITKKLPYNDEIHLPQKLNFKQSDKEFSVEYRRNSSDESLFVKIIDIERDELVLSARVVKAGRYDAKSSDGNFYFSLVPKEIENDIDIRIFDSDTIIQEVEE